MKLADSVSALLSSGAPLDSIYREILMSRLEVQYSLALLQISHSLELRPKKGRERGDPDKSILKISGNLADALKLMGSEKPDNAVFPLLEADATLGHMISAMMRHSRGSGAVAPNKPREAAAPEMSRCGHTEDPVSSTAKKRGSKKRKGIGKGD